jgi:hypothetical protein
MVNYIKNRFNYFFTAVENHLVIGGWLEVLPVDSLIISANHLLITY